MTLVTKDGYLDDLEARSIYILREAFARVEPLCKLWSIGKDSTALLPLVQLDTEKELPEVSEFRDRIAKEWDLGSHVELCSPESTVDQTLPPGARAAAARLAPRTHATTTPHPSA